MWKDWEIIDEAAERLGVPAKTRQKWRQRRSVPFRRRHEITRLLGHELVFDAPPTFRLRKYRRSNQEART